MPAAQNEALAANDTDKNANKIEAAVFALRFDSCAFVANSFRVSFHMGLEAVSKR